MTKEERGSLLRERFKALGGIPWTPPKGQPKRRVEQRPACPPKRVYNPWSIALTVTPVAWVAKADAEKQPESLKRNRGESPLTRIAKQLPVKLRKVT